MSARARDFYGVEGRDGFLGFAPDDGEARIVVLGAGRATPYPSVGPYCADGPAAIRAASAPHGASGEVVHFDLDRSILGHVPAADRGDLDLGEDAAANRATVNDAVAEIVGRDAVPVVLGGDDSVAIPFLRSFAGRKVTVLQFDAHIDWRDEVEGETEGLSSVMRRASEMDHVERIVQVGQRGIGSARHDDLATALDRGAILIPAHKAIDAPHLGADPVPAGADVVVCLDFDVLDPSIMPAVIARTAGGLGYCDVLRTVERIAARSRVLGLVATEFMPDRDVGGLGADMAAQMLTALIGVIAAQR